MGRYLSANFIAGAVEEQNKDLNPIPSFNGYIAYNHFWKPEKLSSSFSISAFQAFNDSDITPLEVNKTAYSISGNLKYDPVPVLRLGVEFMYGYRELENGVSGSFNRIQVAAKYTFGYHNAVADEKR